MVLSFGRLVGQLFYFDGGLWYSWWIGELVGSLVPSCEPSGGGFVGLLSRCSFGFFFREHAFDLLFSSLVARGVILLLKSTCRTRRHISVDGKVPVD